MGFKEDSRRRSTMDKMISYALFTRRLSGNRVRECFELRIEETVQGYALVRQLNEESYPHPAPMRTEKDYADLGDAVAEFEATVSHLSMEGSYKLQAMSHAETSFNNTILPAAGGY